MVRPSPPTSSSSWFQLWPPATPSSWTISALTRAPPCAPRSRPPAPISSTCRPIVPTSIPSSRSSPSSKHSCARPQHAPSLRYGTPSENSSSASLHTNAPTTSQTLAMVYLDGIRSSRLGFCRPDRIQHFSHLRRANGADGQGPDRGGGVGGECGLPLLAVHRIPPSTLMVRDVEPSRLVESYAAGFLEALAGVLVVAGVDRVQAALDELAR